jgi:hypothetical protein
LVLKLSSDIDCSILHTHQTHIRPIGIGWYSLSRRFAKQKTQGNILWLFCRQSKTYKANTLASQAKPTLNDTNTIQKIVLHGTVTTQIKSAKMQTLVKEKIEFT